MSRGARICLSVNKSRIVQLLLLKLYEKCRSSASEHTKVNEVFQQYCILANRVNHNDHLKSVINLYNITSKSVADLFRDDNRRSEINRILQNRPLPQRTAMAMIPQAKTLQDKRVHEPVNPIQVQEPEDFSGVYVTRKRNTKPATTGPPPAAQTPNHAIAHVHAPFMPPPSAVPFNFPMPQVTLSTVPSLTIPAPVIRTQTPAKPAQPSRLPLPPTPRPIQPDVVSVLQSKSGTFLQKRGALQTYQYTPTNPAALHDIASIELPKEQSMSRTTAYRKRLAIQQGKNYKPPRQYNCQTCGEAISHENHEVISIMNTRRRYCSKSRVTRDRFIADAVKEIQAKAKKK